jgi:hypothetical protein
MILKFDDRRAREAFNALVRRERRDISYHLQDSRVLPHILVNGLNTEQETWVRAHLGARGRAYADVQFHPAATAG